MKINKAKAVKFFKANKWVFFQMGCMVLMYVVLPAAIGYANDASNVQIDALKTPMTVLENTFTSTVPKVGVTIAGAAGATSWALGTENQVTKYALRVAMGGGIGMAIPATVSTLTGTTVSGLIF